MTLLTLCCVKYIEMNKNIEECKTLNIVYNKLYLLTQIKYLSNIHKLKYIIKYDDVELFKYYFRGFDYNDFLEECLYCYAKNIFLYIINTYKINILDLIELSMFVKNYEFVKMINFNDYSNQHLDIIKLMCDLFDGNDVDIYVISQINKNNLADLFLRYAVHYGNYQLVIYITKNYNTTNIKQCITECNKIINFGESNLVDYLDIHVFRMNTHNIILNYLLKYV